MRPDTTGPDSAAFFRWSRCKGVCKYRPDRRGGKRLSNAIVDRIIDVAQRRPDASPDGARLAGLRKVQRKVRTLFKCIKDVEQTDCFCTLGQTPSRINA